DVARERLQLRHELLVVDVAVLLHQRDRHAVGAAEHVRVLAVHLHVRMLQRDHLVEARVHGEARCGPREDDGDDAEHHEPELAVVEDESRDALQEGVELHCSVPTALRGASFTARGPASPSRSTTPLSPWIAFASARVVPVCSGWKVMPLSRLTSATPEPPASTIEPSGSFSPPMSAAVEAFSTPLHVAPLSFERKMRPRMPKASTAPSSATTPPKSDPLYGEATGVHVLPQSPEDRIVPASPRMSRRPSPSSRITLKCLSSWLILRPVQVLPSLLS